MKYAKEKQKIDEILTQSKNIMILGHIQPDLDSFGSCIGFKKYLDIHFPKIESKIYVIEKPSKMEAYEFMKGFELLNVVDDISEVIANYDTLVLLDVAKVSRAVGNPEVIDLNKLHSICIDHHHDEPDNFDFMFADTETSSCSELICEILLSDDDLKDEVLAESLFLGIYGDTGGFLYIDKDRAKVFSTTQRLVENGNIKVQNLVAKMSGIKKEVLGFLIPLLKNTKFVEPTNGMPAFSYTYLERNDYEGYKREHFSDACSHYMFNYIRKVEGYTWGFIVSPNLPEENFRFSLRSVPGSVNVQNIAKEFSGGGHFLASGARINPEDIDVDQETFNNMTVSEIINKTVEKIIKLFDEGVVGIVEE